MAATTPPQLPKIQFRVLIIGRANAGKTSILQRVCDTTDSPTVHRRRGDQTVEIQLDPSIDRGEHSIEDELVFANHSGYVFHDSRGFESGSIDELEIVQNFIREKSKRRSLRNRLHAIWYCIPMDNQRPELDIKFFKDICPDKNVPVIAVFTKYDQFLINVQIYVEDYGNPGDSVSDEAKKQFEEHYLSHLGEGARFVQLQRTHKKETRCNALLETTAEALNDDVVALMLLAVQRSNLELSISVVVTRLHRIGLHGQNIKDVVRTCLVAFPQIWVISERESGELRSFRGLELYEEESRGDFRLAASERFRRRLLERRSGDSFDWTSLRLFSRAFLALLFFGFRALLLSAASLFSASLLSFFERLLEARFLAFSWDLLALSERLRLYEGRSERSELLEEAWRSEDLEELWLGDREELEDITAHVMSLSIITMTTPTPNANYYLRLAIVLIFKRAVALCHSGISPKMALTQAESEFQNEHIMLRIEELFPASYQEYIIQQFIDFLINTNIVALV